MTTTAVHPAFVPGVSARSADQASRLRALVEAQRASRPAAPVAHRSATLVAISSGKGGVGKTNLAVNLCVALAHSGRRVALVDADLGAANADVMCGLTPMRRLDDVIRRRCGEAGSLARRLDEIMIDAPGGFRLAPGALGVWNLGDPGSIERSRLFSELSDLGLDSDAIIIDTGAGIGPAVIAFITAADLGLIVATPEPTSLTDAYGLIKCLMTRHAARGGPRPRIALVVNEAAGAEEAASVHARLAAVCGRFLGQPLPMIGWIQRDERVGRAIRMKKPVLLASPRAPASRDIDRIARRLAATMGVPGGRQAVGNGALHRRVRGVIRTLAGAPAWKEGGL